MSISTGGCGERCELAGQLHFHDQTGAAHHAHIPRPPFKARISAFWRDWRKSIAAATAFAFFIGSAIALFFQTVFFTLNNVLLFGHLEGAASLRNWSFFIDWGMVVPLSVLALGFGLLAYRLGSWIVSAHRTRVMVPAVLIGLFVLSPVASMVAVAVSPNASFGWGDGDEYEPGGFYGDEQVPESERYTPPPPYPYSPEDGYPAPTPAP